MRAVARAPRRELAKLAPLLEDEGRDRGPAVHVELREDSCEPVLDRLWAPAERGSDLAVGQRGCDQVGDLALPGRRPRLGA